MIIFNSNDIDSKMCYLENDNQQDYINILLETIKKKDARILELERIIGGLDSDVKNLLK